MGPTMRRVRVIVSLTLQPISSVSRLTSSSLPVPSILWLPKKLRGSSLSLWRLRVTRLHWAWLRAWRAPAATSRGYPQWPSSWSENGSTCLRKWFRSFPVLPCLESTGHRLDTQLEGNRTTSTTVGNRAAIAGGTEPQRYRQSVRRRNQGARWRSRHHARPSNRCESKTDRRPCGKASTAVDISLVGIRGRWRSCGLWAGPCRV